MTKTFRRQYLNPWYWIHKILPRTLFARSLLIIVIPALLLQIVVMSVFVDNHWRKVTSRLAFGVAGEVAIFADEIDNGVTEDRLTVLTKYAAENLDMLVTYEPGEKLKPEVITEGTWEPFTARALSKALRDQVRRPFSLSISPEDDWVNIGIQLDHGVLRVLALERRLFSSSAYIFLFWLGGSSVILFTIAIIFMRNQIRPIRRLALAAERVGMGREISNFKPEGAREVRQAGRAFLEMHERITRQVEQRTAMLAGISHDLRTPLTRMKLALSFLGEGPDVKDLKQDINDMERMIHSYLDFVRGDEREPMSQLKLMDMLGKLAETARRNGKTVELHGEEGLMATVRPLGMERALSNIIGNAEKYASEIHIRLTSEDDLIDIIVDDNGPGIKPELYDDVFKPFYRVDAARNQTTGGVGLGLPIVKDIIHAHGGHIMLDKSPLGGLRVEITLPQ